MHIIMKIKLIIFYLLAIISANLIAFYIGQKGLIITAFILIPFDFIIRAYFHEKWKGKTLWINLFLLIFSGAILSLIINFKMIYIAIGSFGGFLGAGFMASVFYQISIKNKYWFKVNGSDLIAIITDSFIFQLIAFNDISFMVMSAQILIKFIGGFVWYLILFKLLKIQKKWEN